LDRIVLGGARPSLLDPRARKVVAYHESGHALVAWLTPEADPVHKVTIIPRGRALGVTEQLPGEDRFNYSRSFLLARLDVMLGGRVSEELCFGDVTTGAESDLVQATRLARRMVTRWGMGSLGPLAFAADEEQPFLGYQLSQGRDYSEATAALIDRDLRELLSARHEVVEKLLTANRSKLDQLAAALLREETVGHERLRSMLGPRPMPEEETAGGGTPA
jgi:cell division protease FtsH